MGTLALDIAPDFDAQIGDTFAILTATGGFTGAFDDFQGFDLTGPNAFELTQINENTLGVTLTTDELLFL